MTQLTTPTGKEILIVELPEGAEHYHLNKVCEDFGVIRYWINKVLQPDIELTPCVWNAGDPVIKLSDVTEEQARELVEAAAFPKGHYLYYLYPAYTSSTAVESFHSWLKSIGITLTGNEYLLIKK